jgi:hypothetical protein
VVVVDGNVEGDLHGLESVTVRKTARVVGNIFAPRVALAEGAAFNGRINMSGASIVEQDDNQGANADASNPAIRRRVENAMMSPGMSPGMSPAMSPGRQLAAEQSHNAPTQKVILVPPPPVRARAG